VIYNYFVDSRQRFLETMCLGAPDRPPLFAEGLRDEVLDAWRKQGMSRHSSLFDLFVMDERQEIEPDLWPSPYPRKWPSSLEEVEKLKRGLNATDPKRLPENWPRMLKNLPVGKQVRMLYVHHGFFESVGVEGWERFNELMFLLKDDPVLVQHMLEIQGAFNAQMAERLLQKVSVEAAIFSEPIGGNHGPLISPRMYRDLVLPSYRPILDVLHRHEIQTIIIRTYANIRALIPAILEAGFNCLWAVEVFGEAMDYRNLRAEFGADLRLIGGIDLDMLREDKETIRRELSEKLPPLLAQGGYAPLADGRVRPDVPWENYSYYRSLLQSMVGARSV
jgi:Uroporphyrinogen decarboxylase (URO-D)